MELVTSSTEIETSVDDGSHCPSVHETVYEKGFLEGTVAELLRLKSMENCESRAANMGTELAALSRTRSQAKSQRSKGHVPAVRIVAMSQDDNY